MRDQRDVDAAEVALGLLDHGVVRREIRDIERCAVGARSAADVEIGDDGAQVLGVARNQKQRVAARGEDARGRFGNRRCRTDDQDLAHHVSMTRRQNPDENRGSTCGSICSHCGK
jgi:hypothetical protein